MLDQAYTDIQLIGYVASGSTSYAMFTSNSDVWASATTNFTAGVLCAANQQSIPARYETLVYCGPAIGASVQYVTIQRTSSSATQLAIMEMRVYRKGSVGACILLTWHVHAPEGILPEGGA